MTGNTATLRTHFRPSLRLGRANSARLFSLFAPGNGTEIATSWVGPHIDKERLDVFACCSNRHSYLER